MSRTVLIIAQLLLKHSLLYSIILMITRYELRRIIKYVA